MRVRVLVLVETVFGIVLSSFVGLKSDSRTGARRGSVEGSDGEGYGEFLGQQRSCGTIVRVAVQTSNERDALITHLQQKAR